MDQSKFKLDKINNQYNKLIFYMIKTCFYKINKLSNHLKYTNELILPTILFFHCYF